MKKIILAILAVLMLAIPVSAAEYTYSSEEYGSDAAGRKWNELMNALPEDIKDELGTYDLSNAAGAIAEKTDVRYWLGRCWGAIMGAAREALPDMQMLLSVILLTALAKALLPDMSQSIYDSFNMLARAAVAIPLMSATFRALLNAQTFLTNICSLMNTMTPVMDVLYIAEGSLTEASVATGGVMLAVTVIGNINANLIAPITSVLFTLAAVTSVCGDVGLGGFTDGVRKFLMRIWQIVTLLFSFMIGTQSVIARSADTLATRTARFAIGSMVPVAGGIISEAYNTLREGVKYLKTAAGAGGIILILLILLSGIVPLLLYKAAFGVTAYGADMLGLDSTSKLLREIKGVMDLIIAIVLYTSMMFVFAIVLFAKSREG